ncbi:MAG TPA: nicotinate (nicotinamide) nucleotide adenylyltransferase [Burkholderiaceae bacterium]|nr:nicotinate (nicotinamide) nucleotide adenylyltransferase [Burkholderiaceae bacterium]
MKRIGLFGGSFDPPHNAHVAMARLARDHLALDELRLIPAGDPWQKSDRQLAPAADRLAMLRLAFEDEPGIVIDESELKRSGPSYTIDTIEQLQSRPDLAGAQLFLVIGQDQYANLHTWHRWPDILRLATLAVAGREGEAPRPAPQLAAVTHRMVPLPLPPMPVSATAIRSRATEGDHIDEMVPPPVADYIEHTHLYRS